MDTTVLSVKFDIDGDYKFVKLEIIENNIPVVLNFYTNNIIRDWFNAVKYYYNNIDKNPANLIYYYGSVIKWVDNNPEYGISFSYLYNDDGWNIQEIYSLNHLHLYDKHFIFLKHKDCTSWEEMIRGKF